MLCPHAGCGFYGDPDRLGRCSAHGSRLLLASYASRVLLRAPLPVEIRRIVLAFLIPHDKPIPDIVVRLGLDPADVYHPPSVIDEGVFRLSRTDLPLIGCDDVAAASRILGLPGRVLRRDDAIRVMAAIDTRNPHHHTAIAVAKALVAMTPEGLSLPDEPFRVGKCYAGTSPLCVLTRAGFSCPRRP